MATLRIFLTDAQLAQADPGQLNLSELEWRLIDGKQTARGTATLAELPRGHETELMLPASLILKTQTQLPPGGRRQARRLLPFALDNVLLTDSSKQHLALHTEGDHCRVAIIDKALFSAIIQLFANAGLRLRAVWSVADILGGGTPALWYRPGGWLAVNGDEVLWFDAATPRQCPALLAQWLAGQTEHHPHLYIDDEQVNELDLPHWREVCYALHIETPDIAARAIQPRAIPLLQGEFAAGSQIDIDWRKLQLSGALISLCLLAWLITWLGSTLSLRNEEKALRESMAQAFKTAYPNEPLIDPKLQFQSKLRQAASAPQQQRDGISLLLETSRRIGVSAEAPLVALDYRDGVLALDYSATPSQLTSMPTILGAGFNVSRSTPSGGTERFTIKPR